MNLLTIHIDKLNQLCKNYNVKNLYAFGSILTNHFNEESDIDLLVNFDSVSLEKYADNYYDLKFSLEDLFKRNIDLIEEKAIKNPFFKQSVEQHKKIIYAA